MNSKDMITLIKKAEYQAYNNVRWLPSRIKEFQTTDKYDKYTYEVEYDQAFEQMIDEFENVLNGKVYRPTAKKILNNWYAWAVEFNSTK